MKCIQSSDTALLANYLKTFTQSLKERNDQLNYRTGTRVEGDYSPPSNKYKNAKRENFPVEGDTILHLALLMNFDSGDFFIELQDVYEAVDKFAKNKRWDSTGGDPSEMELIKKEIILNPKILKAALADESDKSLEIKAEVARLLVLSGSDPSIPNNSGMTPIDFAQCLSSSRKIVKILKQKSK